MEPTLKKILVVGGNGFLGSAVCKAALARGLQVTSISSSGRPYRTPKGHSPAWTARVDWQQANALRPETYAHLLPSMTAVVHTLGTLLEDTRYKTLLKDGDALGLAATMLKGLAGTPNPLAEKRSEGSYETMNRDAALRVCEAFVAAAPTEPQALEGPRSFVYVSAEDVFRPFVPARYIEAKREAEIEIERMLADKPQYRGVYVRPSLIYHPHYRPLTSPVAALLDLSATIHARVPSMLPTPSNVLRTLGRAFPPSPHGPALVPPSPLDALANALTIPPIHVDHVAEAICIAADNKRTDVRGVVDVRAMRELIGWAQKGTEGAVGHASGHA